MPAALPKPPASAPRAAWSRWPAWLLVAVLSTGCVGDKAERLLADAQKSLASGDTRTAEVQLREVLRQRGQSAQARLLFGQLLLARGDTRGAEVQLRKAADLKAPADQVLPLLAQALLANQEYRKLVADLAARRFPQQPDADADLSTSLAIAHEALGNRSASQLALQAALKSRPGYPRAEVFQVRLLARAGDPAGALRQLESVLERSPKLEEAWQLKGDLILATAGSGDAAVAAYRQALVLRPSYLAAHQGLLEHWFAQDQLPAAAAQLKLLQQALPGHALAVYYEAMWLHKSGRHQNARELLVQLLKAVPDNARGLQLAGAVELALNSTTLAEQMLSKALALAPELSEARRLLVQTYLASHRGDKAVEALQPLLSNGAQGNLALLELAVQAHQMAGDKRKSESYAAQVLKLKPDDWRARTQQASDGLNTARHQQALAELREIAGRDPGVSADIAQVRVHLQRREVDQALAVLDRLEQKQPGQPLAHNLRGMVRLAQNRVPQARESFERALKLDPAYFPAAALLASLDMAESREPAARARFDALLKLQPGHVQALLALAELNDRAGDVKAALALLDKAVRLNPSSAPARVALVEHHLRQHDLKAASLVVQQGIAALPDRPEMLEAQGRVQTLNGEYNQALDSFNSLARALPRSPQPALRMAEVHIARKAYPLAVESLQRALELAPDHVAARQRLGEVQLAAGNGRAALETARALQRQQPDLPAGFTLEAEIHTAAKAWAGAADAYRRSLAASPNGQVASKLHQVLSRVGRSEAQAMEKDWLRQHPNDAGFRFYLGSAAVMAGDLSGAQAYFESVLKLQPNNAPVLNNLAWIALQLKQAGAMAYAQKANLLVPRQPAFMDTLSMALEADDRLAEAISLQQQALALQPSNHPLRLRLAKLHLKAGDKRSAHREVEYLEKLGRQYPAQAAVQQLRASL